jgi:hypothetical protein
MFRVAAVYAITAWLLIQVAATDEAPLSLPEWLDTSVIVLLAIGFPVALILAWSVGAAHAEERPNDGNESSAGQSAFRRPSTAG